MSHWKNLPSTRHGTRDSCYTGSWVAHMPEKANVTLRIDASLLREARILAAAEGTSVSRLLADRLEELIRRQKSYEAARRRALARLREGYDLGWRKPLSRDELHER